MLSYFGEVAQPCGNCDTCLRAPSSWDGSEAAQKLMSTIVRLDRERRQHFGAGQVIDILRGKETERVRQWRHQQLSTWGIGADLTEAQWRGVVRQLLARGDLGLSADGHSTLRVSDLGWEVLRGRRAVPLREDVVRRAGQVRDGATKKQRLRTTDPTGTPEPTELTEPDTELFDALRDWRRTEARTRSVPPYVVFHDSTLRSIAAQRPTTLDELAAISGVGTVKLETYGSAVLSLVSQFAAA
jgi:ATP-dependent DNA helicase RecQ